MIRLTTGARRDIEDLIEGWDATGRDGRLSAAVTMLLKAYDQAAADIAARVVAPPATPVAARFLLFQYARYYPCGGEEPKDLSA